MHTGEVVKLDRGYPLVRLSDGETLRCEHATALVKGCDQRAVIGDVVSVSVPDAHDKGVIEAIAPRTREFVRKDPTERAVPQVLAANFERVIVAQPVSEVNLRRLERELVLAFETGAAVTVVLTKADLAADDEALAAVMDKVRALAGPTAEVLLVSDTDPASVEAVRQLLAPDTTTVLIGRSGVGKSSLVNMLVGEAVLDVGAVREGDGKGRHTTVSREIVAVPGAGRIVDMPGVRGLGLWDADTGIEAAFPDIEALAERCRFRDCTHHAEPGCAVRAAVESGTVPAARYESYQALKQEMATVKDRREQARRLNKDQARYSKQYRAKGGSSRKKRKG
ncbi:ribosome small subunit-dependent GTPase A [Enterorhabdus mucosicola]|uniref:Small ribosomal subunit biogenesis GTPase RsgA n=1 Tax=Adlercreutzia mucosicola TaxID=580026 RepID=A0A6N8JNL5_9ACTN|nr:ribosome small subunit-dependent GTPase A [Adlercreutzia mucosicola]